MYGKGLKFIYTSTATTVLVLSLVFLLRCWLAARCGVFPARGCEKRYDVSPMVLASKFETVVLHASATDVEVNAETRVVDANRR